MKKLLELFNLVNRLRPGYQKEINSAYAILSKTDPFHVANGESVDNLVDLFTVLKAMEDPHFSHHVNEHKNDFSEWIHHCVRDSHLAETIRSVKDKDQMTIAVGTRVRNLLNTIKND
ncbi:MAG: DUF5752 family protein [Nanobdellota archaeon]